MRILIVDDSAFMRKIIKEMIQSDDSFEIVGVARDGVEGVEKALELKPDMITMDIEMPRKNGIDALREIMARCKEHPPAVLMCSSLTVDGSVEALKALRIGAVDFIAKDPQTVGKNDPGFKKDLLDKLRAIGQHRVGIRKRSAQRSSSTSTRPTSDAASMKSKYPSMCTSIDKWTVPAGIKAIVVGSSTGGPPVLEKIFSKLPPNLPVPIFVAQHMPELFTESLARRLNTQCVCGAELASHGTSLNDSKIYIAQGGKHFKPTRITDRRMIARTIDEVPGASYKPSVDLLFETASKIYGSGLLAIQLTGMGEDGAAGAKIIHKTGGHVIAQSEDSCVVYGMPRAVIEAGVAHAAFSPNDIQRALTLTCEHLNTPENGGIPGDSERRGAA
ncbi:MAG: chemotaxis response regulator protein-glutamate methylesterase [Phycisphaerales bacterium]